MFEHDEFWMRRAIDAAVEAEDFRRSANWGVFD
jgi:hypothetical protein